MSYRVEFTTKAMGSLSVLPKNIQLRLADQITLLADDPRPIGARKIKGQDDCYRIRQGDYRIIYAVLDDQLFVLIVRAGHRKDVYERIESVARMIEHFRNSSK